MAAEEQLQTAAGLYQSSSKVHQLLHNGLDSTPLGGMTYRSLFAKKPQLANGAQDVVGQSSKAQDQGIGCELARREPLEVHVGFDLAVELLARSMILIEPDDLIVGKIQCCPPAFELDLRDEKELALAIDGPLSGSHHSPEPVGLAFMGLLEVDREQSNSFACTRHGNGALLKNPFGPLLLILLARVPLDDEAHLLVPFTGDTGFQGIMG